MRKRRLNILLISKLCWYLFYTQLLTLSILCALLTCIVYLFIYLFNRVHISCYPSLCHSYLAFIIIVYLICALLICIVYLFIYLFIYTSIYLFICVHNVSQRPSHSHANLTLQSSSHYTNITQGRLSTTIHHLCNP